MFFVFQIPINIPNLPKIENRIKGVSHGNFGTFSDIDYSNSSVNFSPGQDVFVQVDAGSDQPAMVNFVLLNSKKEQVLEISYNKQGSLYLGKFTAPKEAGVYYVHIEIKGEGLAFSGERNINISGAMKHDANTLESEPTVAGNSSMKKTDQDNGLLNKDQPTATPQPIKKEKQDNFLFTFIQKVWEKLMSFSNFLKSSS